MELYQLVYYSRNTIYGSDDIYMSSLAKILASARVNNKPKNVTGFLLADRSWFFQVLEGDKKSLADTLEKIYSDERHTGITIIQNCKILTRSFDKWLMGCSIRTPEKYAIYCRHGIGLKFDPRSLSVETVVALAYDLSTYEQTRLSMKNNAADFLNMDIFPTQQQAH